MIGKLVKRQLSFKDENGEQIWLYGIVLAEHKPQMPFEMSYKMYKILIFQCHPVDICRSVQTEASK
jgi:hypothetical protein